MNVIFTFSMKIQEQITALLFRYDCVIIPGLGGFVANHHVAKLNREQELAYPPSKGIIFNKNLISNDGLLAEALCRDGGLTYAEANAEISVFVSESKNKLSRGERLEFPGLGLLFLDGEKNMQFQPDFSINFLMDSFGLYPVVAREVVRSLPKIHKEEKIAEAVIVPLHNAHVVDEKEAPVIPIRKSAFRRYWPAAAILLPVVFYSVWIPTRTDFMKTGKIEFADLNPFSISSPNYAGRTSPILTPFNKATDQEWYDLVEKAGGPVARLPLNEEGSYLAVSVVPEIPVAESTNVHQRDALRKERMHLHLIGGCFRELGNAENLVADLKSKGHDAYILDVAGGLHRVAIESYSEKNDALQALQALRNQGNNSVWLLEK